MKYYRDIATVDKKDFITQYKVENGKIYIYYANNRIKIIPYTPNKESKILKFMEAQEEINLLDIEALTNEKKLYKGLTVLSSISLPILIALSIEIMPPVLLVTLSVAASMYITGLILRQNNLKKQIKYYNKLNYFINNDTILNDDLLETKEVLSTIQKKQVETIKEVSDELPMINHNTFDQFTIEELKNLKEAITNLYEKKATTNRDEFTLFKNRKN